MARSAPLFCSLESDSLRRFCLCTNYWSDTRKLKIDGANSTNNLENRLGNVPRECLALSLIFSLL